MNTYGKPFVIARTFDAPLDKVWRAWTDRARLEKWFGPKGCTLTSPKLDLRVGGTFLYKMEMGGDPKMAHWGRWVFREVTPQTRLVFTTGFSDEHGAPQRNPWDSSWPLEWLSTVTFEERAGKTTVTVHWVTVDATPSEAKTFDDGHASMRGGWTGTMDQLESYLRH